MHILVLPSWYPNSYNYASGVFFKEQALAIAKLSSYRVGVIAMQEISLLDVAKEKKIDFGFRAFNDNGVNTYLVQYPSIPKLPNLRNKIKLTLFKRFFKRYIKEFGLPDLIHLHAFFNSELAVWVKQNYGINYIVTEHISNFARNLLNKRALEQAKKCFGQSSYNFAVSPQLQKYLQSEFKTSFDYLPNIVDTEFFTLPKKPLEREKFIFINVAFLNENKNQAMLIEAFTKAFKGENVELKIVGDGPEFANLKALIQKLKMQKQIIMHGRVNRDELKELLQNSDAFVLSSRYETFGVVVIEAMACGLPVVATRCGGPEGIVADNKLGILCEIDKDDLAKALKELFNNYKSYDRSFICRYTQENFSKERIAKRLLQAYKRVALKKERV